MKSRYILCIAIPLFIFTSCKTDREDEVLPEPRGTTTPEETAGDYQCPSGNDGDPVEGQYIVLYKSTFKNEPVTSEFEFRKRIFSHLIKNKIPELNLLRTYSHGIKGFTARLSAMQVQELRNDPEVLKVEQDRIIKLKPSVQSFTANTSSTQTLPWGIKRTGYGAATGRTAWVLDTGVDTDHPDLNVDKNMSVSFVCSDPSPEDYNGHGTHVAGTIAAKDNGYGVVGIAPGNRIVSVKVMNYDGSGTISDILEGLEYVYSYASAGDVVNMSLSGGGASSILDDYVRSISSQKKVYFSLAAGNESASSDQISPQRVNSSYVYTVSAMDEQDSYASFSNFGTCVDFACPGVKIASTYLDGQYAYMSGTSMAAPHFAGLLLLNGANVQVDGHVTKDPDGSPDPIAVMECKP